MFKSLESSAGKWLIGCMTLLATSALGCGAMGDDQEALAAGEVGVVESALSSTLDLTIDEGNHDSTFLGSTALKMGTKIDRTLTFNAYFNSNVPYTTSDPSNQGDWCKLMGISTNRIHHNSIRLGWRWNPKTAKVELGFYGYIQGQYYRRYLTSVDLNTWVPVTIRMWNNGETVTVNGISYTENRSLGFSSWIPTSTWVLQTAYFGGDEVAPHKIKINVANNAVR